MTLARRLAAFLTETTVADLPPQTFEHAAMLRSSTVYVPRGAGTLGIAWSDVDAKYHALVPNSGLGRTRSGTAWS